MKYDSSDPFFFEYEALKELIKKDIFINDLQTNT